MIMAPKRKDVSAISLRGKSEPSWRDSKSLQEVFDRVPLNEITAALIDSGNDRAVQLAERLQDGKFDRTNLARHCAAVQIQPRDVWNILIETRKLSARLVISENLPAIAKSVVDAGITKIGMCPRCQGIPAEPDKPLCEVCGGHGEIVREGSLDSQKVALEIGELLNVRVPLIAQQFNTFKPATAGGIDAPDMTDWVRSSDKTFEPNPNIIEAEVIPE